MVSGCARRTCTTARCRRCAICSNCSANRPKVFWRGYDRYDQKNVGFVTQGPEAERVGTKFDTSALANGNGGHVSDHAAGR